MLGQVCKKFRCPNTNIWYRYIVLFFPWENILIRGAEYLDFSIEAYSVSAHCTIIGALLSSYNYLQHNLCFLGEIRKQTFLVSLNNVHGELLYYPRLQRPHMLKFLRPHYFLTLSPIWFIFGSIIHIGPNFLCSTIPITRGHAKIKVTDFEFSC